MSTKQDIASFSLRIALSAGFLSAVASRLGLWGSRSSGWQNFVHYTAQTNSFLPKSFAPSLAVVATIAELSFGLLLLVGFRTSIVAVCAAGLTLLFSIAMAFSFGLKEPLDYSAFAFSAGAFLLSSIPAHKWSIDQILKK
jgi:uncharacterized membrane protein YphA (DoxX/SURF4 family)